MRLHRFANIVFLLLTSCVMMSVFLNLASGALLPNYSQPNRSNLEGRVYQEVPSLNSSAFISGKYQKSLEQFLSDRAPERDKAVLANAALQRALIATANIVTQYPCYPTFFESDRLFVPQSHCLLRMPSGQSTQMLNRIHEFANNMASFAKRYPDKRFVIVIADHSSNSEANPANELVAQPWTTSMTYDIFSSAFKDIANIAVISQRYSKLDDYCRDFFKTDHHWNILGASRTYNLIADELGLEHFDPEPLKQVGEKFYGSNARSGLLLISEDACDSDTSFANLTILHNDGSTESGDEHREYNNSSKLTQQFDFHSLYYGKRNTSPAIEAEGARTAVLISDSYGFTMKRILANNYSYVYTDSDLHNGSEKDDTRLASRIERDNVSDVILVACPANFAELADRKPRYFDQR